MAGPRRRPRQPGMPDAGPLGADIASYRLHLAGEGKAARTVQGYTSAVRWFAADLLPGRLGLRIFEATGADIADLGDEHGHRVLRVCGKGTKDPGQRSWLP